MTAATVGGLGRAHGSLRALHRVSLEITTGGLFCILGPDATGKPTLLRVPAGAGSAGPRRDRAASGLTWPAATVCWPRGH